MTFTITNPCKTTTVNTITVTGADSSGPYSKSVTDGATTTLTFVRPTTQAETDAGISAVCGETSYTLHSDNSGSTHSYNANWAVISGPVSDTYTLTIDTTADSSLIANESSVTIALYIKATLDDYTSDNRESYTQINIVINAAACDCSALAWGDPADVVVSTTILAGTGASSQNLVVPVASTAARSTNAAFDKCYLTSNDCAETGAFDSLQWNDGTGATTLPSWITFTSSGTTTQSVSINPTDGTVKGTHHLVAVFNPTNGNDYTYTALTFTVGCEVTSFTVSGAPGSNPTYDIFYSKKIIDLTGVTYTQSPACGYTFTNSFTSSIPSGVAASIISFGTTVVPSFEIKSTDASHKGNYSVTLINEITIGSGQGQGATTVFNPSNQAITIEVSDPCETATVGSITFNPTSLTVADGGSGTSEFAVPTDNVDTDNNLTELCGVKTYAITDNTGASITTWASIADSTTVSGGKTLTIDTSQYPSFVSSDTTITLTITTTLGSYTSRTSTSTFAVTISTVSCDCSALSFTAPSATAVSVNVDASTTSSVPSPVADTSARSSNVAFDACYQTSNDCATTGSYAAGSIKYDDGATSGGVTLPSWITWNDSTNTLTVAPDNVSYTGSHSLLGTYTPTNGSSP